MKAKTLLFPTRLVISSFAVSSILLTASYLHADILIGWDIPVTTATTAAINGTPASGLSASAIGLGSGLGASSSSTSWRLTSLNQTTSFNTATTGANATNDFFQWTVTTSARTTAAITGSTGFLWTAAGTGPSTSAQLWASVNGGAYTQVGSSATLGASEVNVGTSWFASQYDIASGTTVTFRAAPLGATGGASSPKISWNAGASPYTGAQDVTLTGTTGGGAYNLVWNGTSGNVTAGQTGQFTGTTNLGTNVSTPTFESGDNVTIGQTGTMNLAAATTIGNLTDSNASGSTAIAGGNITAASLTKSGAGTLTLTGSNSFTGGGTISAGTLIAGSAGALGTALMTLNGGGISVTDAAVTSLSVPLVVGSSGGTIDDANNLTLSGAITGTSNTLTKTGAGKLTLSGALGTNKNGVALSFSTGSLDLSGSAKELGGTSTFNGNVSATNTTLNLSQSSLINGTGTLSVNGGTIATVFGSTGGSSTINTNVAFANNVALTGASGKSLKFATGILSGSGTLTTSGSGGVQFNSTAVSTFSGSISNSTTLTATAQSLAAVSGIATTAALTVENSTAAATVGANITGVGSVIQTGTKDVNLTGTASSFSGGLTLSSTGAVNVNEASALGTGTITAGNASSKIGLASGSATAVTITNAINTGATSSIVMAFAPGASKSITASNVVSGSGQLKVSGGGDLLITNASNTYTGGTEIGTGRIVVAGDAYLGAITGAVNFGTTSNSTFVSTTSGSFSSSRSFTIGSSASTGYTGNFDIQSGVSNTINGVIADKAGNAKGGNFNKLGDGTLKLTNSNTYTGTTTVSAGTLLVNGSLGDTALTVNSGATLGGTGGAIGTVGLKTASVIINDGGTLAPGNSPGSLTVNGAVSLSAGSTYAYQFTGGDNGATESDLLDVNGLLTIDTGSVLTLGNLGTYTVNQKFTLFAYDTLAEGSHFSGYLDDTAYTIGGESWLFNYNDSTAGVNGGSGSAYVTMTAVPEPSAILLGGLSVLALLHRRRF